MTQTPKPRGFLTLTLHAHLPYVVNHGSWPHGIEWLHEAAAETYLPLLRVLARLERDGIALHCNLNLSPILLEQLAHPVFHAEFPKYLERKIVAAREDEAFFLSTGEHVYVDTARFWQSFFSEDLDQFESLGRDIVSGFRAFADRGQIEIITSGATHGYMPLLGTDESLRAQIRTAVTTHERHLGRKPLGIWAPECGYRPAGLWTYPVVPEGLGHAPPAFHRIGTEQALSESGLEFFFVDTHLVQESARVLSPYEFSQQAFPQQAHPRREPPFHAADDRRLYHPFYVDGPYDHEDKRYAVTIFPRDPRTGLQVWSGDAGYPGDSNYLDFHKKRWPGGHRYWRVTGPRIDIGDKQPYQPAAAADRLRDHAAHFVQLVSQALESSLADQVPPVLCSPFDAELFGHWWFEGILWLETVARLLHKDSAQIALISCSEYLRHHPRGGFLALHEGSWGAEGTNQVWMNKDTSWTYAALYAAEITCRDICSSPRWRDGALGERIVKQLCRELLLLESSDWQFLITTGAARDYAELRFNEHRQDFETLRSLWNVFEQHNDLVPDQIDSLTAIEERDNIFADIDPGFWSAGAHATRESTQPAAPNITANPQAAPSPEAPTDATVSEIPKFLLPLEDPGPGDADDPV
ncbi:MAG TPA: 1,4-alpha-glucan branching protein domain-containing protein [Acidobacteriaceae bacterium]|nr:1,4-alpha-glucan branching protein domain-containing protein [Acidobacteriaceae bacterium]